MKKQQTDCSKCIYAYKDYIGDKMMVYCDKMMRTTKPICPLYDDGKEVKQ